MSDDYTPMIPAWALEEVVAFHPVFRKITGHMGAGILLSQFWFWASRETKDKDGRHRVPKSRSVEFYKTAKKIHDETGLTPAEGRTARRVLVEKGFVSEQRKGVPAKMYYTVHIDKIAEAISLQYTASRTTSAPQAEILESRTTSAPQSRGLDGRFAGNQNAVAAETIKDNQEDSQLDNQEDSHSSPPAKAGGDSDAPLVIDSDSANGKKTPKPGPRRVEWGNRNNTDLYELVSAWCRGRGHTYKDLSGTARNRATAVAKKLPEKYTPDDVYDCTLYVMSDPWKAENKSDFVHVADTLPTWEASGRPNATGRAGRSWRKNADEDKGLTLEQIRELKAQVAESERGL